jgi:plastocyanin
MRAALVASAVVVLLCTACGDSSGPANEVIVEMRDDTFSPTPRNITAGTTVRWRNVGNNPHNSTSTPAGQWASGTVSPGSSFPRRFDTAGTFNYECTIHPGMNGTIVVQ